MERQRISKNQLLLIIVASLGYFVDIYDLILFNVVKKESLQALGVSPLNMGETEIFLFNCQMAGMLLGGILWGILGDTKGRLKVLFGSILLYSVANIANAFVWDIPSYAVIRVLAGIGLAGELGAGITLISEVMDKERRGYGTMIVVTFGALGAVFASMVANVFDWKISYIVGGVMGLALLAIRVGTMESNMFKGLQQHRVRKGDFRLLFNNSKRFSTYLKCIAMGLPVWFVVGVLINLSESFFSKHLQLNEPIRTDTAVMFCYVGLSVGDLFSGLFSQIFRTRLRIVAGYLIFTGMVVFIYLFGLKGANASFFYVICTLLGIATGYWALFVTIAAEQFGTNIRATVTSTVPNFVRGAVIPITLSFKELAKIESIDIIGSSLIVGSVCLILALWATLTLHESFGKDLDYHEH